MRSRSDYIIQCFEQQGRQKQKLQYLGRLQATAYKLNKNN